ncbi:MAG: MFS transporter [Candidatus Hydrogenedentota bacterium]
MAPILSLYLMNNLGFSPNQAGQVIAVLAIGAILAPFVATYIADRFLSARVMLALCHAVAGVVMGIFSVSQTFWAAYMLYFVYGLLFLPTHGLSNTVVLHRVGNAKRDFGGIRMWGTAGWVFIAWTFGLFWLKGAAPGEPDPRLVDALRLCALLHFALSVYCFALPKERDVLDSPKTLIPWEAFRVFTRPSVIVLCIASLFTSAVHQHYYFGMAPFLKSIGTPENLIMPLMSIGQATEVLMLFLLGRVMTRLGTKRVLLIALAAQVLRFTVFGIGSPFPLVVAVITMHGLCYAFFFTAAYIYIDEHSTRQARAGAQQLYTILIMGFGYFLGHTIAGKLGDLFLDPVIGGIDFHKFWAVPAAGAVVIGLFLLVAFRAEAPVSHPSRAPEEVPDTDAM